MLSCAGLLRRENIFYSMTRLRDLNAGVSFGEEGRRHAISLGTEEQDGLGDKHKVLKRARCERWGGVEVGCERV